MAYAEKITDDIYWIGTNDTRTALFEHVYPIPNGVSYNSYIILDNKTALLDTADIHTATEFLANLKQALNGRSLDYLIVNHMEPDHSAVIERVVELYPQVIIIGNAKTFTMMKQFFSFDVDAHAQTVSEGSTLDLGRHQLTFVLAPMVHWPEAMVTYDATSKTLFSADAFGTFGAIEGSIFADGYDIGGEWLSEYRRYLTNIVGKYGKPVQMLLKKAQGLDIQTICPLHGPIWRHNLGYIIGKYDLWSRYEPECQGVLVAYASIYGHTAEAARLFARQLVELGIKVKVSDICEHHVSELVAESFRFSHIALFAPTYNLGLYTPVANYLHDIQALCLNNRRWVLVENGSWAPMANKHAKAILDTMSNMQVIGEHTVKSALKESDKTSLQALAQTLADDIR